MLKVHDVLCVGPLQLVSIGMQCQQRVRTQLPETGSIPGLVNRACSTWLTAGCPSAAIFNMQQLAGTAAPHPLVASGVPQLCLKMSAESLSRLVLLKAISE